MTRFHQHQKKDKEDNYSSCEVYVYLALKSFFSNFLISKSKEAAAKATKTCGHMDDKNVRLIIEYANHFYTSGVLKKSRRGLKHKTETIITNLEVRIYLRGKIAKLRNVDRNPNRIRQYL